MCCENEFISIEMSNQLKLFIGSNLMIDVNNNYVLLLYDYLAQLSRQLLLVSSRIKSLLISKRSHVHGVSLRRIRFLLTLIVEELGLQIPIILDDNANGKDN